MEHGASELKDNNEQMVSKKQSVTPLYPTMEQGFPRSNFCHVKRRRYRFKRLVKQPSSHCREQKLIVPRVINRRTLRKLHKTLVMVQKVPLTTQSHTNEKTPFHTNMNVSFIQLLVPLVKYREIELLVELNRWATINHKTFDTMFTDLIQPCFEEWFSVQQKFFKLPAEKRRILMSRVTPNSCLAQTETQLRIIMPQLTSYLEKNQIMKLRQLFPNIAEENLLMVLKQERDMEKCIEILKNQEEFGHPSQRTLSGPEEPVQRNLSEGKVCQICCNETKRFSKFKNCEHTKHACIKCSKRISLCPWCRKPV